MSSQEPQASLHRIRQLVQMPYHEYLQTVEWKAKRDEAVERDAGRCRLCYSSENLQVHHRTYYRRGNEHPNDLTTLCKECHEHFHSKVTERELRAQWGESDVPLTEEEQEQQRKRDLENMERALLGMLLLAPEKFQETGIIRIVDPEDFSNPSRREVYRLLADGNTDFTLPSHLQEETQICAAYLTYLAEKSEVDVSTTNNDIVQYACRFKIHILRKRNDDLEMLMESAAKAGDKQTERSIRMLIAQLLRQIRETDTDMRRYCAQEVIVEKKPTTSWREYLKKLENREDGQ